METRKFENAAGGGSYKDNARAAVNAGATGAANVSDSLTKARDELQSAGSDAANAAGGDLQSLRNDLNGLKDSVAKIVSEYGGSAAKSARDAAGQMVDHMGDAAQDLANRGSAAATAATAQARTVVVELENMARRNPIGVIAGAVIVGVLIGSMGRRS